MRLREPAGGPAMGYVIDDHGTPTFVATLALYLDAPEMRLPLLNHDLHAKPLSDFVRDPPVSRPRHALVDLLEAEDIGAPNRFTLQAPLELGPSLAFFDIPRDQANGLIPHGP